MTTKTMSITEGESDFEGMTVKNLIQELQKLPADMPVLVAMQGTSIRRNGMPVFPGELREENDMPAYMSPGDGVTVGSFNPILPGSGMGSFVGDDWTDKGKFEKGPQTIPAVCLFIY
jgi:hypothetical protein